MQNVRPGHFKSGILRDHGIREPLLIKGDDFGVMPQLGLNWPDEHPMTVEAIASLVGGDREVRRSTGVEHGGGGDTRLGMEVLSFCGMCLPSCHPMGQWRQLQAWPPARLATGRFLYPHQQTLFPAAQLRTWDVAKQRDGPHWNVAQWLSYWEARKLHQQQQQYQQPLAATSLQSDQKAEGLRGALAEEEDEDLMDEANSAFVQG